MINYDVTSAMNIDDNLVEITNDDIAQELAYWDLAVVLYVIGSNPKPGLKDGYSRRLWGKMNVDKVISINKGIYFVRFLNVE